MRFENTNESYKESKNFVAAKIELAKLPWGKLGFSICYDLRFPMLYKGIYPKKEQIFSLLPFAFTYTTGMIIGTLTRARAIENGCFVFTNCSMWIS